MLNLQIHYISEMWKGIYHIHFFSPPFCYYAICYLLSDLHRALWRAKMCKCVTRQRVWDQTIEVDRTLNLPKIICRFCLNKAGENIKTIQRTKFFKDFKKVKCRCTRNKKVITDLHFVYLYLSLAYEDIKVCLNMQLNLVISLLYARAC